ncbi:MAG: hypothetical protein Q9190_004487 [Brigantiaea leucoxantha]
MANPPPPPKFEAIHGFFMASQRKSIKTKSKDIATLAQQMSSAPLNEKFYIIGGAAVQLMGSERLTRDIDMVFDSQEAMQRVKTTLQTHRVGASGFAVMRSGGNVVYWYDNGNKPSVVILIDMHSADQGHPPYPVMPVADIPSLPGRPGVPIAPPLLNLCYKLIAWNDPQREASKKTTDEQDIKYLLSVRGLQSPPSKPGLPWAPAWTKDFHLPEESGLGPASHGQVGTLGGQVQGLKDSIGGERPATGGGNTAGMEVWIQARRIWNEQWAGKKTAVDGSQILPSLSANALETTSSSSGPSTSRRPARQPAQAGPGLGQQLGTVIAAPVIGSMLAGTRK